MSLPHKKGLEVRIEFCPSSIALTRSEWAKLLGDYGDTLNKMQGGKGVY